MTMCRVHNSTAPMMLSGWEYTELTDEDNMQDIFVSVLHFNPLTIFKMYDLDFLFDEYVGKCRGVSQGHSPDC
jgi:hypothetical protein